MSLLCASFAQAHLVNLVITTDLDHVSQIDKSVHMA